MWSVLYHAIMKNILITGGAGFIGYHVATKLASSGHRIVIVDNFNDYYSIKLKEYRIRELQSKFDIPVVKLDICNTEALNQVFINNKFDIVINLAAQSGVRYSSTNPVAFAQANIVGLTSVMACAKKHNIEHLLYASSSSVVGDCSKGPSKESDEAIHQLSFYAVTKKTNEMMAKQFTESTNIPTTGLRLFTVYGPMGRPDMAYFTFSDKIFSGETIELYGNGDTTRDFTYCTDVAASVEKLLTQPIVPEYRIVNIGSGNPRRVSDMLTILGEIYNIKPNIRMVALPNSDPSVTWCDPSLLMSLTDYVPDTSFRDGLEQFADWYRNHQFIF